MPTHVVKLGDLRPGDIYEDCMYHPCLCTRVIDEGDMAIEGISLVDGSYPRGCGVPGCEVRKLTLEEAMQWKFQGPADAELDEDHRWWDRRVRKEQMERELLEVYSRDSGCAIVKPPGRKYPGCVIQGDSLAILCGLAKGIAESVQRGSTADGDLRSDIQALANSLIDLLLHYQQVLGSHGIDLPYSRPFSESDLVRLLPDDDAEE